MSGGPGRWTCARCGLVVRYLDGFAPPDDLPTGWEEKDGGLRCLPCRRHAVCEQAAAESDGDPEAVKRAAVAFELRRDPTAFPERICRITGASVRLVKAERRRLAAAGELELPARSGR